MKNYKENDKYSIENYARQLLGESLISFLGDDFKHRFNKNKSKGRLGQVVEEEFFGYKINSKKEADFKIARLELKVAPLKRVKPKKDSLILREREGISAKERIVLSIIDFMEIYKEEWDNNTLMQKCGQLLLMFYLNDKDKPIEEQIFKLINIWSPSQQDLAVIKNDWEIIVDKIKAGKAHEISEGDTMYLGACTKGSTAEKSKRKQPLSNILAPQRAFSLKRSYVDYIIEELLQREKYNLNKYKEIAIDNGEEKLSFDKIVINQFKKLEGKTLKELIDLYNINRERKAKSYLRLVFDDISNIMFGQKLDSMIEFKKANIEVKTILLKTNGMPKESMSFEQINFCSIVEEKWDESTIKDKFENKKHLWVIFKSKVIFNKQNELNLEDIILDRVMFWNMPMNDLEGSMKRVWNDTVNKIKLNDYNNFIKISDNEIAHIRPKGKDAKDVMLTPQGTFERRKCFWLNAKYIKEQIEKEA